METTTKIQKSNNLRHSFTKIVGKEKTVVKIRLNDECKNGHQDFSITCDIYEKRSNGQFYDVGGGAAHEHILKLFPELKQFVDLHLSDAKGVPMYAVENGFYHLKNGFNNIPIYSPEFKNEFCDYYRITPEQFDELATSETKEIYALKLDALKILEQWKKQADAAIKQLETWTGKEFLNDSVKSNFNGLTTEKRQQIEQQIKEGYFTPEKIQERTETAQIAAKEKEYKKIEEKQDKEINDAKREYEVKKAVLDAGLNLDNFIFYKHSNTGCFNWKDYGTKITKEQFNEFIKNVNIEGVNWEIK